MEKHVSTFMAKSQADLAVLDARIKDALREFDELKMSAWITSARSTIDVARAEPEKKRLWGRLFG